MALNALSLAVALLAAAPAAPEAPTALERCAAQIADRAGGLAPPPRTRVAVWVASPDAPELARAAQTLVVARLTAMGFKAAVPSSAAGAGLAEAEARADGADWLLRLSAFVAGGELLLVGDALPTWVNFWAGREPLRAPGGGAIKVSAPADAQALGLARRPALSGPGWSQAGGTPTWVVGPIGRLPERALALAVGDVDGDGAAEVAVLTGAALVVLRAGGEVVARWDHRAVPRGPISFRDPPGLVAIGPPGPLVTCFLAGWSEPVTLHMSGGRLEPAGPAEKAPWPAEAPALLLDLASLVANPRAPGPGWIAVKRDGGARLLAPDLKPLDLALPSLGAGVALGDLDGDGVPELVGSLPVRSEDRLRVFRLSGKLAQVFESPPLPGDVVAGAAGDLSGRGRDEAVMAAWTDDGGTMLYRVWSTP